MLTLEVAPFFTRAMDVFERISVIEGPILKEDITSFTDAVDALNDERLLNRVPAASYFALSGVLYRISIHDANEISERVSNGILAHLWTGLACVVLNSNRLVEGSTTWKIDATLSVAALEYVPLGGKRGDAFKALVKMAHSLLKLHTTTGRNAIRDAWVIRHVLTVWRSISQMAEHKSCAEAMLQGLGPAEELLLADCLVVPGGGVFDQIESLANVFAASLVLHATAMPKRHNVKSGLQARFTAKLNEKQKICFTKIAMQFAKAGIDKHCHAYGSIVART